MIKITATGRLGKDSELRFIASGKPVLGFSIGSDVGWGDKKHTLWIDCSIWGDRGEKLEPYLKKGTPVTIHGDADLRMWESGEKHGASVTCNVSDVEMHGSKPDAAPKAEGFRKPATADDFADDDIPF